jgi:metal-dependent amidase/aminoacylase/carboxypeptidase family protein
MTWTEAPVQAGQRLLPIVIGNRASRRLYQTALIRGTFRTFSNEAVKQIEDCIRRTATGVAAAFGATAEVSLPDVWAQLVNNPVETQFIADVAADLVGEAHVDRNRTPVMGSEDFAYMLEACPHMRRPLVKRQNV